MWPFKKKTTEKPKSLNQRIAALIGKAETDGDKELANWLCAALSRHMRLDKPRG